MGLLKNPEHNRGTLRIYPWMFFPPKKESEGDTEREREKEITLASRRERERERERERVLSISISEWRPHRLLRRIHQLNLHPIPSKIISRYTLSPSDLSIFKDFED